MSRKRAFLIEKLLVFYVFVIYSYCVNFPLPTRFDNPLLLSFFQKTAKLIAVLLPLLFYIQKPKVFLEILGRSRALLLFLLYFTISPIWANDFFVAGKEVVLLWIAVFFSVYLVGYFSLHQILFFIVGTQLLGAVVSGLMWWWYPAETWASSTVGLGGEIIFGFRGSYVHKNHLALAMNLAIIATGSLWLMKKLSGYFAVPLIALFGFLLYSSQSAANYLALILIVLGSLLTIFFLRLDMRYRRKVIQFIIPIVLILGVLAGANYGAIANKFDRSANLTGRTEIWKESLEAIRKSPLVGYGLNSFWPKHKNLDKFPEAVRIWKKLGWAVTSSHNGYIDVALSGGAVGILLWLFVLSRLVRSVYLHLDEKPLQISSIAILGFILFIVFLNFAESFWLMTRHSISLLLFFLFLYDASEVNPSGGLVVSGNNASSEMKRNRLL